MKNPPKDSHLWQELIKGIKPLKHRPAYVEKTPSPVKPSKINAVRVKEYLELHCTALPIEGSYYTETKKLQKVTKIVIEARLDLHGLTRQEAQRRLQNFIAMAHHDGLKWVLIITGKGHPDNPHTLKKLLPLWLEQVSLVTGYTSAKDQHGGQGAYYVRVKSASVWG
ncbi:Smr/MutS family protein [Candidatus Odyssella thessalonicensis]|uniref:Smr/MutS family protein n=1 Tax=Candidatus Odyssella thessalonicensis TaxID=84647 RepID=UPI000225C1E3|nr:Smr/MutS family protein [Candidatus Odyssella thessalonicensis]